MTSSVVAATAATETVPIDSAEAGRAADVFTSRIASKCHDQVPADVPEVVISNLLHDNASEPYGLL